VRVIFSRLYSLVTASFLLLPAFATAAHTQVELSLSADTARPGDTIWAGVDLKMDPGWHTYWKNAGDSGIATTIKWDLPAGITAGDIQWPLPKKLPPAEITTYGYEDEVMLLVPLTIATNLDPGTRELSAKVAWLECNESCVPANQSVQAKLTIGSATKTSAAATAIEAWQHKVPQTNAHYAFHAQWEQTTNGDTRPLVFRNGDGNADKNIKLDAVDFFPDASDNYAVASPTEIISAMSADIRIRKLVKKYSGDWPTNISGVMVLGSGSQRIGYAINTPIAEPATKPAIIPAPVTKPSGVTPASAGQVPALPTKSLWLMLLYAFIGGLILNIMPCVLPVIALKIFGFVNEAKSEPRHVRKLGLVYALGVIVSLMVLAAIVIGVKASGLIPTWGMQFGSPVFLVCLTTLITLVALNLFGVFEVTLSGRALDQASGLASRPGAAGAFFNGVLATTLATPCTAPFLAPALGFAFAQNYGVIVAFFLAIGFGLASPYVLLSWHPAWLKFLPKPGAWMEKFKIAMGFPMLATVMWLFFIAGSSFGQDIAWLGGFLVVVALAAWIFGEFVQRGRSRKTLATIIALLLLVGGYVFILEKELNWRAPQIETKTGGATKASPDGIDWQPWSPEAVTQARAAGHLVLVDFTADWCLTCQVNKKTSIEIPSVRKKLKDLNAVTLIGDNTHSPASIAQELQRFQRAGVPLVLVYPKNSDAQPIVLPEILTPGIVLDALDQAAK
jgi:thiol:disulfide interchange protein DsbD